MTSYRYVFNTLITIPPFDPLSVAYAPAYLPTGRRPVSFRAQSARVPAHRPQAGFFSGACARVPAHRPQACFISGACACVPAHRPQAGFFSGTKRPCTCPPAAGQFLFGREAPVYLPTGRRPVSFRAQSGSVPAHRPQACFLSGAKRPCTFQPAASRFPFGR